MIPRNVDRREARKDLKIKKLKGLIECKNMEIKTLKKQQRLRDRNIVKLQAQLDRLKDELDSTKRALGISTDSSNKLTKERDAASRKVQKMSTSL